MGLPGQAREGRAGEVGGGELEGGTELPGKVGEGRSVVQGQDKGQGGLRVIVTFTDYSNSDTVCANTVEEILKCEQEMVDVNVWPIYCLGGKRRLKKSCVLPIRFCLSRFPGFSQPR